MMPPRRNATPLVPPSLDQKVQVFTREGKPHKGKRTGRLTLPRKKMASRDVAVIGPRRAKLSPWHLSPVHNKGHGLSTSATAAPSLPLHESPAHQTEQPRVTPALLY
jgi:hypothetical protein